MQLTSIKRLLGMDDHGSHNTNNGTQLQQLDGSLEKGDIPLEEDQDASKFPPFKTVILSMLSIYLAFFLSALDRTIIGVAVPAISNEFKSFSQISWYESAFLLTFCVSQFPVAKIYTFYPAKWTYFVLVAIFVIGSIVCASATSSLAFICGRAITGIGGAGSQIGASVIMLDLIPLQKRPKYLGFLGAVFGIASIIGPLIGGLLTTKVSWHWCFWINIPIGGLALVGLLIFLPTLPPPAKTEGTFKQKLWSFDPVGNIMLAPGVVCLLLGLQWGGTKYPWGSSKIISLIVVGLVLLVAFGCVQWLQENGTIPPRILHQRSMIAGAFVSFALGAALVIPTFYLPIWFQAIKGTTAVRSGVGILPLFLGTVFSVIASGIAISKSGYYAPWLIVGCAIAIVGSGLLTTLRVNTGAGRWIVYQIVSGVGTGMTLQQCTMAAQTVLAKKDVPIGLTVISFSTWLGGTISISVCQTILTNTLTSKLSKQLPGFNSSAIANAGATQIQGLVTKEDLPIVLAAYNAGIDNTLYCLLGFSCLAFVGSFFIEWKSVKAKR